MLEVDWTGGDHDGNLYVCWSRFLEPAGRTRSTSAARRTWARRSPGRSRSRGSRDGQRPGVRHRDRERWRRLRPGGRSTARAPPRGKGSTRPLDRRRRVVLRRLADPNITAYFPFDGARDCGDGAFVCPTEYVFVPDPLELRHRGPDGAASCRACTSSTTRSTPTASMRRRHTPPPGREGSDGRSSTRSRTTTDGASWSQEPIAVDGPRRGTSSSRTSTRSPGTSRWCGRACGAIPCYSVQLPMGNDTDAEACGYPDARDRHREHARRGLGRR